jgi:N-glycosylase/DNA lyase
MDNKYIRDPDSLGIMESNSEALRQSRIRRQALKDKDDRISRLEKELKQLTEVVNGILKNGTTSKCI